MKRLCWILAVCAGLGLAACAGLSLPVATPADVARAQTRWPGTTTADLERGRVLYRGRCASCHLPIAPSRVASDEWPGHVTEMQERAGLNDAEADLVLRYLVAIAERKVP